MDGSIRNASRWIYQGVWAVLVRWFKVPAAPPTLPAARGERLDTFSPSPDWLRYLKVSFWILFVLQKSLWIVLCVVLIITLPLVGILVAIPLLLFSLFFAAMVYLAMHLRFDTTTYVMSDRSLRIRRGIWVINETTITFENIQNVAVSQGPLQRYFRIADVVVRTAGGGGQGGEGQGAGMGAHVGLIEGIANAQEIRDRILGHLMTSTTAGLGDESQRAARAATTAAGSKNWTPSQLAALREIRDAVRVLA